MQVSLGHYTILVVNSPRIALPGDIVIASVDGSHTVKRLNSLPPMTAGVPG